MQTLGGVGPSPLHFNKPARQAPNVLRPLGTQKCEKLGPMQPGKPGAMAPVRSASPTLPGTKQVAPTCQVSPSLRISPLVLPPTKGAVLPESQREQCQIRGFKSAAGKADRHGINIWQQTQER